MSWTAWAEGKGERAKCFPRADSGQELVKMYAARLNASMINKQKNKKSWFSALRVIPYASSTRRKFLGATKYVHR